MGRREDLYIPVVQDHLEAQFGRRLTRLNERPDSGPSHDFETNDGARPVIAIEAKELVSPDFLATRSQVGRAQSYKSNVLQLHWMVSYSESGLGTWYDPKSWDHARKGKLAAVSLNNLHAYLESQLMVLERFGIRKSRSRDMGSATSPDEVRAVVAARLAISSRVDGVCLASSPTSDHPPGIDVAFSYSYVRTGFPDRVVERIQSWLDSAQSKNLLESLTRAVANERHAALWLSSDPEVDSAREQGLNFKPTADIKLPEPVDVLWAFLPPVVWRYHGIWTVSTIQSSIR